MNNEATQKLAATLNAGMARFRAEVEDEATEMVNASYQLGRNDMANELLARLGLTGSDDAAVAADDFDQARKRFERALGFNGGAEMNDSGDIQTRDIEAEAARAAEALAEALAEVGTEFAESVAEALDAAAEALRSIEARSAARLRKDG